MNNEQGAIIGHCILNSGNKEMLVDGIANLQFGKKAQLNVEGPISNVLVCVGQAISKATAL
jgi:hypothetical protein